MKHKSYLFMKLAASPVGPGSGPAKMDRGDGRAWINAPFNGERGRSQTGRVGHLAPSVGERGKLQGIVCYCIETLT